MRTITLEIADDTFIYLQCLATEHGKSLATFLGDAVTGAYHDQCKATLLTDEYREIN